MRHRLAGLFSIKGSLKRAYPFPPLIQLASMSDWSWVPNNGKTQSSPTRGERQKPFWQVFISLVWGYVSSIWKKKILTCQITLFCCVATKVFIFYNLGALGDFKCTWNEVEIPSFGGGMPYPCCDGGSRVSDSLDWERPQDRKIFFFLAMSGKHKKILNQPSNSYIQDQGSKCKESQSICWWIKTSWRWQRE